MEEQKTFSIRLLNQMDRLKRLLILLNLNLRKKFFVIDNHIFNFILSNIDFFNPIKINIDFLKNYFFDRFIPNLIIRL